MHGRLADHVDDEVNRAVPSPAAVSAVVDGGGEWLRRGLAVRHVEPENRALLSLEVEQDGSVWGVLGGVYQGDEERQLEGEVHVCYVMLSEIDIMTMLLNHPYSKTNNMISLMYLLNQPNYACFMPCLAVP